LPELDSRTAVAAALNELDAARSRRGGVLILSGFRCMGAAANLGPIAHLRPVSQI